MPVESVISAVVQAARRPAAAGIEAPIKHRPPYPLPPVGPAAPLRGGAACRFGRHPASCPVGGCLQRVAGLHRPHYPDTRRASASTMSHNVTVQRGIFFDSGRPLP